MDHRPEKNLSVTYYPSPVGILRISVSALGLSSLRICSKTTSGTFPSKLTDDVLIWLDKYFNNKNPSPELVKFDLLGTPFQLQIWQMLLGLPYGSITSYGQLAQKFSNIFHKTSPRAVGQAVAKNPVWIIIPCHRVLKANGELGGYAGGCAAKKYLLDHEKKYCPSP